MTDTSLIVPATTVITDNITLYEDTMERHKYKDQMMKGRLKGSQMEAHNKFHMQNTYDAPSSGEHHEGTTSISLDQSPHVAKKILKQVTEESIDEEENPKA